MHPHRRSPRREAQGHQDAPAEHAHRAGDDRLHRRYLQRWVASRLTVFMRIRCDAYEDSEAIMVPVPNFPCALSLESMSDG